MKKKNKNTLILPPSINKLGPDFVTVFKKRRAGPADARRKRVSDVAKGRSRKPRTVKEKAEDNPASFPPRYWVKVVKEPDLVAAFLIDGKGEERGRVLAHLYPRSDLKREYQLQLSTLSGRLGKAFTPWVVREAYLNRDVVGKGIGTAMYERILAEVSHLDGALLPQVSLTGEHPDSTGYPAAILWNRLSAKHRGEGWVVAIAPKTRSNPWSEDKIDRAAPCRKCGGYGHLPSFSHVENGVCFRCTGSGLTNKDWRCSEPEKFTLLDIPVRVYTVKGSLKVLVRQKDFDEMGTPMLEAQGIFVSPFFNNNGTIQGAITTSKGWTSSPLVSPPKSSMFAAFPKYWDIRFPDPPLSERSPQERKEIEELQPRMQRAEIALSQKLTDALREHYGNAAKKNPTVGDWRYTTPETFTLLGNRVRVYTVQGPLRLLIRQKDFDAGGISALNVKGPAVATFFNNNGTVQGAHSPKNLPWVPAPIVRIPDVWMLDVCPEYQNILTPAPYVPLPPRAQERLREGIELLKRQASALSRELTTALRSHYDR